MSAAQMKALIREAAAEGLTEAAEHVQTVARERTPDDPGTGGDDLRASITVEPATEGNLESAVYTDSEYALYQHENLTLAHPTGQSKFLETATLDSRADVEKIVGAAVKRKLS
jgi:hypothetical protein